MGFVIDITDGDTSALKDIIDILDIIPSLNEELLELGMKLADDTASTYISTFQTMLPAAIKAKYRKYVRQTGELPLSLLSLFKNEKKN